MIIFFVAQNYKNKILYFTRSDQKIDKNNQVQLSIYRLDISKIKSKIPELLDFNIDGYSTVHPSLNSNSSRKRKRYSQMSDINVTPFVDVMLVLLIVFMVTAPLLTVGIPVDLPKVKASALTDQKDPLEITVKIGGEVYLGESRVEVENLIARLNAITELNKEARIYVRGDRVVAYGRIMEIMSLINSAGYIKVALVTQNPKDN